MAAYRAQAAATSETDRTDEGRDKTGVFNQLDAFRQIDIADFEAVAFAGKFRNRNF